MKFQVGQAIFHNDTDEDLAEDARLDGRVTAAHDDGTYDIEYAGGGYATRVPELELEEL